MHVMPPRDLLGSILALEAVLIIPFFLFAYLFL